jgi:hypothetical protein
MKRKMLALGCLSVCWVAMFAMDCQAWHCRHKCAMHITCRPYNAFTPICWGNITCDGCCPSPCGVAGGQVPMMGQLGCGVAGYGMPYATGFGAASATDMRPMMPPAQSAPFVPPVPMPVGPNTTMVPPGAVAQANYPMYAPQYYVPQYYPYYVPTYATPYMGWPTAQPMPYYWGYGR